MPGAGVVQVMRRLALVALCALLLASCAGSDGPASTTTPPPTSNAAIPPEVAAAAGDWPLPGHDYANTRASTGSTIRALNVAQLVPAWTAEVAGGLTTAPLIIGDTVYVQDRLGGVQAIDVATGEARWKHDGDGITPGPNGVAVGYGKLFAASTTGVFALDAATGEALWSTKLTASQTEGVDMQPIAFDHRVYISTVPVSVQGVYKGGDRGVVYALDADTGAVDWKFDTVDSVDVWGNPELNSGGGAWYPPAIDPGRGLVYVGTANPAPFPGTAEYPNGASRPGPNLYTDSAVALDARTGALRWYHQAIPHDLFDRDHVHTMLVDHADGTPPVLVSTGKGGHVLGLEPDTGELLWDTPVGLHQNDDLTSLSGPTEIAPGTFGGVLTPPATADGIAYVAVVNGPQTLLPDKTDYFGAKLGVMDGQVVAVDARDGSVAWDTKVPGDPLGGATVVNDLVFTATLQGAIVALDRATGAIVWQMQAAGGIIGWMSVSSSTIVVPVGNASPPQVVALRLPGG